MADSDDQTDDGKGQAGEGLDTLADELFARYDPERLLRMVARRAGRGDSLDHQLRAKYERRFGVDLSHVRIYTGEFAEEFNRQRNAHAVTIGSTGMILMGGSTDRSMASSHGQALLAHELTHVAQAQRGVHRSAKVDGHLPFAEEHEVEAEEVEAQVLAEQRGAPAAEAAPSKESATAMFEDVKQRVLELLGDAARTMVMRGGLPLRRA